MKIVVLTGAGMSVESGLSTFRGGGLWDNYPVEQVATPEGFAANPSLVLEFYNKRRKELQGKKPNKGHELLASLEKEHEVIVVTQNVDDLHERAGSTNIIHLHGEWGGGRKGRTVHLGGLVAHGHINCTSKESTSTYYILCQHGKVDV